MDKGVHAFLKGINPKENVIVRLEFELATYNATAQHVGTNLKVLIDLQDQFPKY